MKNAGFWYRLYQKIIGGAMLLVGVVGLLNEENIAVVLTAFAVGIILLISQTAIYED